MSGIHIKGDDEVIALFRLLEEVINESVTLPPAQLAINLIKQRTAQGKFLNGSGKQYSKAGALFAIGGSNALKRHYRSKLRGGNRKGGMKKGDSVAKWVFLENGYYQYRSLHNKQVAFVNLHFSGNMMTNLRVQKVEEKKVSIGYEDGTIHAKKAYWLSMAGAGKNKKKYEFFGLDEKEESLVFDKFKKEVNEFINAAT
jgi:hypothetical protein